MKIREMAEGDIPALARLNCDIFKDTGRQLAKEVFTKSFHSKVDGACLVAEEDGKLIGGIIVEKITTFYPNAAGIKSFFVMEEYQGKGIGKALLEGSVSAMKTAGVESVSLSVDPGNKSAISVYEKEGFGLFRLMYLKRLRD